MHLKKVWIGLSLVAAVVLTTPALAVDVLVSIESLSGSTGIGFSPLVAAAHDGSVDLFDNGSMASPGVEQVAELGSFATAIGEVTSMQSSAVAANVANADSSVGPLLPGVTQSVVLSLDPTNNRYFSFLSMAVPSNDAFIGNDNPTAIELFDAGGNFAGQDFKLNGEDIWDAGTEVNALTGALFVQGQDGSISVAENGVVHPADLSTIFSYYVGYYVGETTPPGYEFSGGPDTDTPIVTISFAVVPEPAPLTLFGLGTIGWFAAGSRRQRRRYSPSPSCPG